MVREGFILSIMMSYRQSVNRIPGGYIFLMVHWREILFAHMLVYLEELLLEGMTQLPMVKHFFLFDRRQRFF